MQTIRTEHAARAAIADTLQARAAMVQAFRNIKPAPVRRAPVTPARRYGATLAAACLDAFVLTLAGCGGGSNDTPDDTGAASIPARPASSATI
jgi:hypothetical protein